jgi:ribosome biogenesis GTPase / thiamine phosphate phosphatase
MKNQYKNISQNFLEDFLDDIDHKHIPQSKVFSKVKKRKDLKDHHESFVQSYKYLQTKQKKQPYFILGVVVEVHKNHCLIAEKHSNSIELGLLWLGIMPGKHLQRKQSEQNFLVVGDIVIIDPIDKPDTNGLFATDLPKAQILYQQIRSNFLGRGHKYHGHFEQVLFANISKLYFVTSLVQPMLSWGFMDRYLVSTAQQSIPVQILVNKMDLWDTLNAEQQIDFIQHYEYYTKQVGIVIYTTSILDNMVQNLPQNIKYLTIQQLKAKHKNNIIAFSGHSGVGKSSLINALGSTLQRPVDDLPSINYKGRHTTTFSSLLVLENGGFVIDTAGIKSFPLFVPNSLTLSSYFSEFKKYPCQYPTCTHTQEDPHVCGIKKALQDGILLESRYKSYISILENKSFRQIDLGHGTIV